MPTNAFHLNNNLIGLHFMACIFFFLSPRSISLFEKIYFLLRNLFLNLFKSLPFKALM
jgi:hypothetical protein